MNTINICLGHKPFPQKYQSYADLFITPDLTFNANRVAYVPDSIAGENGQALSEYLQLLWLHKNIDKLAPEIEYIRIFQYRRFASKIKYGTTVVAENAVWVNTIKEENLYLCADSFDRYNSEELFNTPINFDEGVAYQYSTAHVIEDLHNFTNFLVEKNIIDTPTADEFLNMKTLIPACNIGVFKRTNFQKQFDLLSMAAEFLFSKNYIRREGYQRRSVGFLLERLQSYLILYWISAGHSKANFGLNYLISDKPVMVVTVEKVA